jgi:hypothetical protein
MLLTNQSMQRGTVPAWRALDWVYRMLFFGTLVILQENRPTDIEMLALEHETVYCFGKQVRTDWTGVTYLTPQLVILYSSQELYRKIWMNTL